MNPDQIWFHLNQIWLRCGPEQILDLLNHAVTPHIWRFRGSLLSRIMIENDSIKDPWTFRYEGATAWFNGPKSAPDQDSSDLSHFGSKKYYCRFGNSTLTFPKKCFCFDEATLKFRVPVHRGVGSHLLKPESRVAKIQKSLPFQKLKKIKKGISLWNRQILKFFACGALKWQKIR